MKPLQSFYLDMKSIHGAADGVQGGDVSHRARLVAARDDTKPGIKAGEPLWTRATDASHRAGARVTEQPQILRTSQSIC